MKKNQKGFGAMDMVIILIIAILVGVVGWYAWQRYTGSDKYENSINSFETCKAAGFPIRESYPEQCAAGDQVYTNPEQSVE